jgi:hypothetical protein
MSTNAADNIDKTWQSLSDVTFNFSSALSLAGQVALNAEDVEDYGNEIDKLIKHLTTVQSAIAVALENARAAAAELKAQPV